MSYGTSTVLAVLCDRGWGYQNLPAKKQAQRYVHRLFMGLAALSAVAGYATVLIADLAIPSIIGSLVLGFRV